jgi:PAS domain-containing protein
MEGRPIKVLLLEEQRTTRCVASQLLAHYDLDFDWQCVSSTRELQAVAARFDPTVVLCADDLLNDSNSSHGLLSALRLLCSQTPAILVSSLSAAAASAANDTSGFFSQSRHAPPDTETCPPVAEQRFRHAQDPAQLRLHFSLLLESSTGPVIMSDSDGWITYANTSACRLLNSLCEGFLGTLLYRPSNRTSRASHWLDTARSHGRTDQHTESSAHRLAYFDAETGFPSVVHIRDIINCVTALAPVHLTTIALAAMNLNSVRISDDCRINGPKSDQWFEFAEYGTILRITQGDFLLTFPDPCHPADAAITACSAGGERRLRGTMCGWRRKPPIGSRSTWAMRCGGTP